MISCPSCHAEQTNSNTFCSACGAALKPGFAATVAQGTGASPTDSRVPRPPSDSSHHGRFLPGTKVANRYRIVSLVGKGGMGEVYRADDLKLGHTVALKYLPEDLADNPQRLEYFHSEVRLTRQISHPNVCRVYDIGEIDGQHFLSMEYIDGEDLKVLLRRIGRLPKDKGVQIAQQLCAGLAAAHDRGVLHRDLKPANIMIDGHGQVRITDFGLAKLAEEGAEGEVAGTPAYMAPEQLTRGEATIQSDLYSMGLILYELFTGKAVHQSSSLPELIKAHKESSPSQPSNLVEEMDPAVERVILRCLERKPHDRPKSAHAVAMALPGGDPLAAALAAGETPTPEMVAAAGEDAVVDWRLSAAALAGVALCLLLNVWLSNKTSIFSRSQLKYEPAVLRDEVQEMVAEDFGYEVSSVTTIEGFTKLQPLGNKVMLYWFRQRPRRVDFAMNSFWSSTWGQFSRARPDFLQPSWTVAGEMGVMFTGDKRLRYFRALPPTDAMTEPAQSSANWSEWFTPERTGFYLPSEGDDFSEEEVGDAQVLEIVEGRGRTPPDAFDAVGLWKGRNPNGRTFLVEAAAFRGKPTYFNVVDDENFESLSYDGVLRTDEEEEFELANAVTNALYGALLVVGIALAWRNLRLGRGDRVGGRRLAGYVLALNVIVLVAHARHTTNIGLEVGMVFTMGLSQVLFNTSRTWVWYMALEPFVRCVWPQILITTSRLLEGRLRDPLVGRDLLAGVLFGVGVTLLFNLDLLAHEWLSAGDLPRRNFSAITLVGIRELVGSAVSVHESSFMFSLFVLLLLLVFRITLKTQPRAIAAFLLVLPFVVALLWGGHPMLSYVTAVIRSTMLLVLLVRFGILAVVVEFTTTLMLQAFPLTWDATHWYFGRGICAVTLLAAVAFFGFFTSTLGNRSIGNAIDSTST